MGYMKLSTDSKEIKKRLRFKLRNRMAHYGRESGRMPAQASILQGLYEILLTECWQAAQIFTFRQLATDHRLPPPKEGKKAINRMSSVRSGVLALTELEMINSVRSNKSGTMIELIITDDVLVKQ